jgi:hypothetical protein
MTTTFWGSLAEVELQIITKKIAKRQNSKKNVLIGVFFN